MEVLKAGEWTTRKGGRHIMRGFEESSQEQAITINEVYELLGIISDVLADIKQALTGGANSDEPEDVPDDNDETNE